MGRSMGGASLVVLAFLLASCGGQSGDTISDPQPTQTPVKSPAPSLPASVQRSALLNPTNPVTIDFGRIDSGATAQVVFPATASGSATATAIFQTSVPGNIAPQVKQLHKIGMQSAGLGTMVGPLAYLTLTVDSTVTSASWPEFIFTFPAGTLSGYAYLSLFDMSNPSAGWSAIMGPIPANGTGIDFDAAASASSVSFKANVDYVFAVLETGEPVLTPTPIPTPTPSSTPTPSPTPTPRSISAVIHP